MNLIGNDIIDLELAKTESNWQRRGYLEKIFTEDEQTMIMNSIDPSVTVWLLWSMKEAAYKIYSRVAAETSYAPLKLTTKIIGSTLNTAEGRVYINQFMYFTKSLVEDKLIHTVAASTKQMLTKAKAQISIHPDKIYPDYKATKPQSVSHHGIYLALVYL